MIDKLKTTGNIFILKLMAIVQLPGSKTYATQMTMHYATHKADVSLSQEFQNSYPMHHVKME